MKKSNLVLALAMLQLALLTPAFGISVSMSGGSSGQVTSTSTTFELSPDSQAYAHTTMAGGQSAGSLSASGTGAIYTTSDGVGATVAGDDLTTNMDMSGSSITGNAILSGVPFGIDARFDLGFVGEAITGDGTSLGTILTGPVQTPTGGNPDAYWLSGKKWTQLDPQVKMSVNAAGSGLTTAQMQGAVSAAAETWDAATNQNLFSDGGAVVTTAVQGKYDKQNVISFLQYNTGCTALASAGTWYQIYKPGTNYQQRYDGKPGNEYPIVESDIAFNSNYKWTTTGESGKYDFQSVALHEMGHTIGLGDLYNKAQFSKDTRQVMHYYTGVKRTLGNGDATGVWKLYG
jgi:hypothetical protein